MFVTILQVIIQVFILALCGKRHQYFTPGLFRIGGGSRPLVICHVCLFTGLLGPHLLDQTVVQLQCTHVKIVHSGCLAQAALQHSAIEAQVDVKVTLCFRRVRTFAAFMLFEHLSGLEIFCFHV
jgi:hypothetical protein